MSVCVYYCVRARVCVCAEVSHHIHRAEDMTVMVVGLQVFGDVSKRTQVFWILSRT